MIEMEQKQINNKAYLCLLVAQICLRNIHKLSVRFEQGQSGSQVAPDPHGGAGYCLENKAEFLIPRPCMPSVSLLCAPPLDGAFQLCPHQFITVTESSYAYLILRVTHAGEKQDIVYISLFKDGKQKVSKLLAQGCTTNLPFLFQLHIRSLPLVLYNYYKE